MPRFVYRLVAEFDNPFVDGPEKRESTTAFATREIAASRIQTFKDMIRERLKSAIPEIDVKIIPMEVIEE